MSFVWRHFGLEMPKGKPATFNVYKASMLRCGSIVALYNIKNLGCFHIRHDWFILRSSMIAPPSPCRSAFKLVTLIRAPEQFHIFTLRYSRWQYVRSWFAICQVAAATTHVINWVKFVSAPTACKCWWIPPQSFCVLDSGTVPKSSTLVFTLIKMDQTLGSSVLIPSPPMWTDI